MKYVFKFLAYLLALIFWPITMGWAYLILYGDRVWCLFWHLGHDWKDITGDRESIPLGTPTTFWCSRCHLSRKEPACVTCEGRHFNYGQFGGATVRFICNCQKEKP